MEFETVEEKDEFNWKPEYIQDYTVPKFNLPESRAKGATAKRNAQLAKVLAFIHCNKQRRSKEFCTIMPIPTTNKKYISICGSSMGVSRLIQFMIQLGLIETENGSYQFNAYYDKDNHSKTYRYYIENEKKVEEICNILDVKELEVDRRYIDTIVNTCKIQQFNSFDNAGVRFSSSLHLEKPGNMSKKEFEDCLTAILAVNYPQLKYYSDLAKEINDKYYKDYPDFAIKYTPTFTWDNKNKGSRWVHKIGIRATNGFCSCKDMTKQHKKNDNYCLRITRQEVFKAYLLHLSKDIASSVPRVTLSINSGYWISEEEIPDIYLNIYRRYERYNKEVDVGAVVDTCKTTDKELRNATKKLFMFAYFDDTSVENMGNHVVRKMKDKSDRSGVYE